MIRTAAVALTLLCGLVGTVSAQRPPAVDETDLGPAVFVGETIIKGYDPTPALVTKVTPVARPKFPATDIHAHWSLQLDPAQLLAAMDDLGLERAVNLSGGFGDQLDRMLDTFHAAAPGRLVIFANLDPKQIDAPDFGQRMAAMIRSAHAKGLGGLKIFKSLGLTIKDASGRVVPIDDPRFDPIWATCGELGIPVLIHSADPIAFFDPIDEKNERWVQLHRHPDWSFHGPQFPSFAEVIRQHDAMIARHPKTTFISAHMGSQAEDLASLSERLGRLPNLVVDLSGRVAELGRQPYASRRFCCSGRTACCLAPIAIPADPISRATGSITGSSRRTTSISSTTTIPFRRPASGASTVSICRTRCCARSTRPTPTARSAAG